MDCRHAGQLGLKRVGKDASEQEAPNELNVQTTSIRCFDMKEWVDLVMIASHKSKANT